VSKYSNLVVTVFFIADIEIQIFHLFGNLSQFQDWLRIVIAQKDHNDHTQYRYEDSDIRQKFIGDSCTLADTLVIRPQINPVISCNSTDKFDIIGINSLVKHIK